MDIFNLHRYSWIEYQASKDLLDGPIVFTGNKEQCNQFAKENNFHWKPNNYICGGFYKNPDGDCLIPDSVIQ